MSVRAICLVADVWIEIYGGIARFLCDSMAVKGKADSLYRGCLQFENHRRTAIYNTPLFIGPYAAANNGNNTALLA